MRIMTPFLLLLLSSPLLAAEPKAHRDLAYAEPKHDRQTLDVYAPTQGKGHPVVVWIHGGGWQRGDKADVQKKPQAFVDRGFVFVSINYRLLPDVTIKQMAGDVAKAIRWTHDHAQDYGGDADTLLVMGHSAGAQLAALVCTDDRYLKAEGLSLSLLKGCVPVDGDTYDVPMQTQAWKRDRVEALALPMSERHIFVPIDFETQALADCLDSAGFDWNCPTLFSWVGSTMYVNKECIASTLSIVAACAQGSEIVLSYNQNLEFVDEVGREFLAAVTPRAAEIGEPVLTAFSPTEMEELMRRCGLSVAEHPTADDLSDRYCAGRTNDLRPYTLERLISAGRLTNGCT